MTKKLFNLANAAVLFLLGLYVTSWYPRLPRRFPSHFDLAGNPDRWSGRSGFLIMVAVPFLLTFVIYVFIHLIPRMGARPQYLNIPRKEEFLKLPAEKQAVYWSLLQEFFAGLAFAVNLFFAFIIQGTVRVAAGEANRLPFAAVLPALGIIIIFVLAYLRRLFVLPGRLIRGDE